METEIITNSIDKAEENAVLVIPGGRGTRTLVNDGRFLKCIFKSAKEAKYVLSICTGSALLAKSGVSAGMDMSLGFVSDLYGKEKAEQIASDIEYLWNDNKDRDDFA